MPSLTLRSVDDYDLAGDLGAGSFAIVKLGVHRETGERVALKLLLDGWQPPQPPSSLARASRAEQLAREQVVMDAVRHPHVIRTLRSWDTAQCSREDTGDQEECSVAVLELCPHGDLSGFVRARPFGEVLARTYFLQLLSGVAAIHRQGIVHRDLKLENLALDAAFQLKITDFGFAAKLGEAGEPTQLTQPCGTHGYAAPELYLRRPYGQEVDAFACGVILFVLVAGFMPFDKAKAFDWDWERLAEGRAKDFWRVHLEHTDVTFSAELRDLVQRVLTPAGARRLDVAGMQAHPWCQGPTLSAHELEEEMAARYLQTAHARRMAKVASSA